MIGRITSRLDEILMRLDSLQSSNDEVLKTLADHERRLLELEAVAGIIVIGGER